MKSWVSVEKQYGGEGRQGVHFHQSKSKPCRCRTEWQVMHVQQAQRWREAAENETCGVSGKVVRRGKVVGRDVATAARQPLAGPADMVRSTGGCQRGAQLSVLCRLFAPGARITVR